jgi:spermidine synthase
VISTQNVDQVEETVHYAMSQRPDARKVLLISGGIAGTAREILRYGVAEVTYVELDPLILAAGRRFLPENLADPRIRSGRTTDARRFVQQTRERYDVVIVDCPIRPPRSSTASTRRSSTPKSGAS